MAEEAVSLMLSVSTLYLLFFVVTVEVQGSSTDHELWAISFLALKEICPLIVNAKTFNAMCF